MAILVMVLGTQTQEMVIKPVSNPSMVMDLGCNNLPKPEIFSTAWTKPECR